MFTHQVTNNELRMARKRKSFASCLDRKDKPQFIVFSATMPAWVHNTTKKYMTKDFLSVDLVKGNTQKTNVNVEVHSCSSCSLNDYTLFVSSIWLFPAAIKIELVWSTRWFTSIPAAVSMDVRLSFARRRKKPINCLSAMRSKPRHTYSTEIFHKTNVNLFYSCVVEVDICDRSHWFGFV